MRALFHFQYGTEVTQEQLDALNMLVTKPIGVDEESDNGRLKLRSWQTYEGNINAVMQVIEPSNRIELQGLSDPNPIVELTNRVEDLLAEVRRRGPFNEKVGVQVPGNNLLEIRSTKAVTNCCSDELSGYLEEGWVIVAACPQPDQRRPDYVLGHRDEGLNPA